MSQTETALENHILNTLNTLPSLTHSKRTEVICRLCVTLKHNNTTQLHALLHHLTNHTEQMYQMLGLFGAKASKQTTYLLHSTTSPSQLINTLAISSFAQLTEEHQDVITLLTTLPAAQQKSLIQNLLKANRRALAPHLINVLLAQDELHLALKLIPLCDDTDTLKLILQRIDLEDTHLIQLKHIARHHPDILMEALEEECPTAPDSNHYALHLTRKFAHLFDPLIKRTPERMLRLLEQLLPWENYSYLTYTALRTVARHHPDTFAQLILCERRINAYMDYLPTLLHNNLRHWDMTLIRTLMIMVKSKPLIMAKLLKELPPSQRGELFEHTFTTEERQLEVWPEELLAVLPHTHRHQETSRILTLPNVKQSDHLTITYTTYLTPEEAQPKLSIELGKSDADARALAWQRLLLNLSLYRHPLTDLLTWASKKLKNEQDPVRGAFIAQLSCTPAIRFQHEDAPLITKLITSVTEARDTSSTTKYALEKVMRNLIYHYAYTDPNSPLSLCGMKGIEALSRLGKHAYHFSNLRHTVSRESAKIFVQILCPFLKDTSSRTYDHHTITCATSLYEKGHGIEELDDLLHTIMWSKSPARIQAAEQWLRDPSTRNERIERMLAKDSSAFTLRTVYTHISKHRQDLLTPLLSNLSHKGHFNEDARVQGMLPVFYGNNFYRWSTSQQRLYKGLLMDIIHDTGQQLFSRTSLISTLASLPVVTMDDLTPLIQHEDVPICEAALGATIRLDQPQPALEELLNYTHGDRARVAMYALPKLAKLIQEETLLKALQGILERDHIKVTVHKEVLRLLGAMKSQQSSQLILSTWQQSDLHKDTRIAALHAARQRINTPEGQEILKHVAQQDLHEDIFIALLSWSFNSIPINHIAPYIQWMMPLGRHDNPKLRAIFYQAVQSQLWVLPLNTSLRHDFIALIEDEIMHKHQQRSQDAAINLLVHGMYKDDIREKLTKIIQTLTNKTLTQKEHSDITQDNHDLVRLLKVIQRLTQRHTHYSNDRHKSILNAINWPTQHVALALPIAIKTLFIEASHTEINEDTLERLENLLQKAPDTSTATHALTATSLQVRPLTAAQQQTLLDNIRHQLQSNATSAPLKQLLFDLFIQLAKQMQWPREWRIFLLECRQLQSIPLSSRYRAQITSFDIL